MLPDDRLDALLRGLRDAEIPDGPPAEVVARTRAALERERTRLPRVSLRERIRAMPTFVRIAAAVLIAAGAIGLLNLGISGRTGPGVAFADAIEQVRAARTMTYTLQVGDDPPMRVSRMEPGLMRAELPGGSVSIVDRGRGRNLVLDPDRKTATLIETRGGAEADGRGDDLIDRLRDFRGEPREALGERSLDGRPARGFRVAAGGWSSDVWVDAATNRPVRLETRTNFAGGVPQPVVFREFEFDPPLDAALFRTSPPEGYRLTSIPLPIDRKPSTEKDLVDLLGEYARRSGGRFPDDLQVPSFLDVLDFKGKAPEDGLDPETMAWIARVGKGVGLVWAMPPSADVRYTGKGVRLGQADRPIFRYRPQDSRTYRVIHGDLTVKDVEPDAIAR